MTGGRVTTALLLALLDGATFANAIRNNGKPCRVRLPDDPDARGAFVRAHLQGAPSTLVFHADGHRPWTEHADKVALAAFCPAADGRCRWIGVDLDGTDHGAAGLADPVHGARTIAERATAAGLMSGLLVARSRHGQGRHVFLLLPGPIALTDAVLGVAALVAAAFKVAKADAEESGAPDAFLGAKGAVACPGDAGAVELLPRSTTKPQHGWGLMLPAAGTFAAHGGGVIVDPFDDEPLEHRCVPRCDGQAWRSFITESREAVDRIHRRNSQCLHSDISPSRHRQRHPLTDEFLGGRTPKGRRNTAAFAAACTLLRTGLPLYEVNRQILQGARGCELPEHEAHSAVRSALRAVGYPQ
jgi:hypothetical protein